MLESLTVNNFFLTLVGFKHNEWLFMRKVDCSGLSAINN